MVCKRRFVPVVAMLLASVFLISCSGQAASSSSSAVSSKPAYSTAYSYSPPAVSSSSALTKKDYVLEWGHTSPADFPQKIPEDVILLDKTNLDFLNGAWRYYPLQSVEDGSFLFGNELLDLTVDTEKGTVYFGIGFTESEYSLLHNGAFSLGADGTIKGTLYKTNTLPEEDPSIVPEGILGPEKYTFSIKIEIPSDGGNTISVTLISCSSDIYDNILGTPLPFTKYIAQ